MLLQIFMTIFIAVKLALKKIKKEIVRCAADHNGQRHTSVGLVCCETKPEHLTAEFGQLLKGAYPIFQ